MTFDIGATVVARGLPVNLGHKVPVDFLPPRIALVVSLEPLRIKLRVGGIPGARPRWCDRARPCKAEHLTRLATAREMFLGMPVGP